MLSFMQVAAALKGASSEPDLTKVNGESKDTTDGKQVDTPNGDPPKDGVVDERREHETKEATDKEVEKADEPLADDKHIADADDNEEEPEDQPDGRELEEVGVTNGVAEFENERKSVSESDKESLLDKVDLFDIDTKDELELEEVREEAAKVVAYEVEILDHNGNETVEEHPTVEEKVVSSAERLVQESPSEIFAQESPELPKEKESPELPKEQESHELLKEQESPELLKEQESSDLPEEPTLSKLPKEQFVDANSNGGTCIVSDYKETDDLYIKETQNNPVEKVQEIEVIQREDSPVLSRSEEDIGSTQDLDSLEKDLNTVDIKESVASEASESLTNVTSSPEKDSINFDEMPEKQDTENLSPSPRGDGVLSPSLQRANFRYRWAKTVRTNSNEVTFFSSYKMEEPVRLTWSEACECYYSMEYDLPTGIYKGNLVIDGHTYPVEDLTIKHYTFEADLYVKEDLAEDEAKLNQGTEETKAVDPADTQGTSVDPPDRFGPDLRGSVETASPDSGIHKSSKYEELVRKQLSQSNAMETEMNRSNLDKSEYGISGRRTPIGDVATEPYQDGGDSVYLKGERPLSRGSVGERPLSRGSMNNSLVEDEVEKPRSMGRHTPSNSVEDFFQSEGRQPLRSPHSSARQTPQQLEIQSKVPDYTSPLRSQNSSVHGSSRQTPTDLKDAIDDVLGNDVAKSPTRSTEGSLHSSARGDIIDDVLGLSSPVRSEHGSAPVTPRKGSTHSSTRMSPQITSDAVRTSQEKPYGSRPQSLTSEQELTQYFENGSRHNSVHGSQSGSVLGSDRSESKRTPSVQASPGLPTSERPLSTSSLPVITTQQRLLAEKRSMTPDNHIRVPGDMSPAVRALTPRSGASSRASDRTITPTSALGLQENGFKEDGHAQRILDLEDSVRNLRKLLSSREAEVHELNEELKHLKELNKSLTEELDRVKVRPPSRSGIAELERKYTQVLNEKEILAEEVVKLRDEIDELRRGRPGEPEGDLGETSCGISSYNPNNPYALQRRISDLQSQVQDLQEANESAVSELSGAERRIEDLKRENEALREGQHGNIQSLQAENRQLHDQISRLYEQGYGSSKSSKEEDHRLKIELQQIKDDNRALKERNYKLHEENLRLKEETTLTRETERSRSKPSVTPRETLPEARMHQTDSYLEGKISQMKSARLETSSDRLSASERFATDRPYTSPLKSLTDREEIRASSTLKKPVDPYYATEKSYDQQFRSSYDKYRSMKSNESADVKYRPSADRDDTKLRSSLGSREEGGFKLRSMDTAELRIRSALEKADANLRSADMGESKYDFSRNLKDDVKDESKYRYGDKLNMYSRSKDSARSADRSSYDRHVDVEKSRSELYRTMPDGGSSDKEMYSARERYERSKTPERLSYNTLDLDSERLRYDKDRKVPSMERDFKPDTGSSYEWMRSNQSTGIREKSKEWSRSEADLRNAHTRGRSRKPERYFFVRRRSISPPEHESSSCDAYPMRRRYDNLPPPAHNSAHKYRWDDEVPSRHTVGGSVDRGQSDMSDRLPTTSKTTPSLSIYRPKEDYRDMEKVSGYDLYKRPAPYQDDTGDMSDTATDILVNAEPFEKREVSPIPDNRLHRRHGSARSSQFVYRKRRDSLGSSGSISDVEDIDDQLYGRHSRSKSADGRELIRRSQPLGATERSDMGTGTQGERTLYKSLPVPSTANLRTVTPNVLTTQHNRNMLTSSTGSLTSLTTGMRPFAPRSPADISIEDVVKFSRQGGKLSQGRVKFVGHLPGRSDAYLGVELDKEDGKHDGKFEGMRYFRCKPNKGVFVAFNKVVMAWAP